MLTIHLITLQPLRLKFGTFVELTCHQICFKTSLNTQCHWPKAYKQKTAQCLKIPSVAHNTNKSKAGVAHNTNKSKAVAKQANHTVHDVQYSCRYIIQQKCLKKLIGNCLMVQHYSWINNIMMPTADHTACSMICAYYTQVM